MSDKLIKKRNTILKRSENRETASNYDEAVDLDISSIRNQITNWIDHYNNGVKIYNKYANPAVGYKPQLPTGLSNCTLTATQWVNPNTPIGKAQTIIDNGEKYGYRQIPEVHALPGDLVIATNPENNHHHTMLLTGFINKPQHHTFQDKDYVLPEGHPLVRYSNGSTHPSGYRKSVGLMEYIDNSEGKTNVRYYRHYDPGDIEILLPEIVVTPKK